ncbi:MAG: type III secretion inner membrane ring lipoprotein SctJ [Deltaproteobacteria bacterium]|jgi:type III secretion protein J|nr:type III secretion inner membrane ring lipoprotein SctJ [Deltaproteobacteria bacterium]
MSAVTHTFKARTLRLLALLLLACLCSACQVTLYSDLTEQEANEMIAVLSNNGVAAQKVTGADKGLWNLSVEEHLLPRCVEILSANGLPRSQYQSMGGVFKKEGMVSSPTEEKARLVFAISQELAGTIAAIDGVLNARVHLVLPELDSFGNKISPSTASVFIKHRADVDLASQVSPIKRLVENSVRDLKYESISVFLFPSAAGPLMPLPPETSVLFFSVDSENAVIAWATVIICAFASFGLISYGAYAMRRRRKSILPEQS